jgi:hypothetical protein
MAGFDAGVPAARAGQARMTGKIVAGIVFSDHHGK